MFILHLSICINQKVTFNQELSDNNSSLIIVSIKAANYQELYSCLLKKVKRVRKEDYFGRKRFYYLAELGQTVAESYL